MEAILVKFLQDVAQGVYGKSSLTYTDINKFEKKATPEELKTIKEFYWDCTSELTEDDEIDVSELEEFIKEVINRK